MNDNPPPLGIHPDDPLEARLTAWVLGEASPFEIAELESLVAKSPELQLFLNRTRALHALLQEAETTANQPDDEWKLHPGKRFKIARAFGEDPEIPRLPVPEKESRIRRASFRAAWGIAAVFVVTFFSLRLLPRDYEAEAVIEIKPRERMVNPLGGEMSQAPAMTEQFFGTEFEKIKSRNSLLKVVDDLDLTSRWNTDKETALKRLKDSVETENIRGTDLIAIRVRQPDEQDAKEITRAVTEGYRDFRNSLEEKQQELAVNELRKAVREMEDKVEDRRKILTTISRTKNIIYNGDPNTEGLDEDRLAQVEATKKETKQSALERSIDTTDYVDAKRDFESDQALLEQMKAKLITEEISADTPNDSIVIHEDPAITDRKFPSNPLAALRDAITPETKSSVPLARAEMAAVEPAKDFGDGDDFGGLSGAGGTTGQETIEIAEDARSDVRREAHAGPTAELEKSIVDAGIRSGDQPVTRNSIDSILNNPARTAAAGKPAEPAASAPADARIKEEIASLDDPVRTNPARISGPLTEENAKQVDEVRRKLYMAEGNFDLGKFDDAKKAYEDTLRIDPYNKAARRGMEKLAAAQSDYYRAAYDHTRAELLMDTDSKLEVPAEERTADLSPPPEAKPREGAYQDARAELLAEVDKAWERSIPADPAKGKKGEANAQVDPFAEPTAPGQIASLTGLFSDGIDSDFKDNADSNGSPSVTLRSGADGPDVSISREFEYPTEYEAPEVGNLVMGNTSNSGSVFPVTPATPTDFDGLTNYGAPIAGEPKQVDITTKHVEITQANDKELGFDWIVSPFTQKGNISSGSVFPVTPATPTDFESYFESRITGGTLEVAPILGDIPVTGRLFREKQPSLADLSEEIAATQEPFSTFSLNISDASFQLALAAVEKGERPDPASIKPEQFYNAVDYGDPAPSSLEPVAAAIDQTAHPVIPGRNLVRVAIRTASTGRSAAQPLRLTLLVDQSGSMARADRRAAMDAALAQLATLLTENDRITVIGFSRTPRLIADSLPGNEAAKISDLINTTASEGGTNLEQAFNLSSELALRHKLDGAQNRIVLFTDGAANLGDADPDRLAGRVKELRQQGLAFDIAGIGTNDTNDRLLSELARHGNGRYYLVGENAGDSFAAQLAGAFRPAAENVKVQVKLNPERVGSYKLIGFEKDRLKTEDFRDDSVDAAELADDEAGVAIYQVETLPEGSGEIGEVSVRFRDTASGEMVERAWTIPHDPSTPALDKADPKTQIATLALLAAQKLQGGPLADAIRFSDHAETIAKLKQTYANDAKAQRLLTLINALR